MTLDQFVLPAALRRIHRQEWNQFVRMLARVGGDIRVRHPKARQFGFSTEHNGLVTLLAGGLILLPPYCEVYLHTGSGPACLVPKIVGEMLGILEEMCMNVHQHQ